MSIELPPLPAVPAAGATPEVWARYLQILALHSNADGAAAVREQTAEMTRMVQSNNENATATKALLAQLVAHPEQPSSGFSETFVMSLLRLVLDKPEPT